MLIIVGEHKDEGRRQATAHPVKRGWDRVVIAVRLSMCRSVSPTELCPRPRARVWAPKGPRKNLLMAA